jgi:hypothetical protein
MDLAEFCTELDNYRIGVMTVLPASVADWTGGESDDLDVALYARDVIEEALRANFAELKDYVQEVVTLDNALLSKRQVLLAAFSPEMYRQRRESLREPKSHWWWYLDQLTERQCSQCQMPMEVKLTNLIVRTDGTAPGVGLIVYTCPQCGEKHLPRLSLEILMELINQAFEPVLAEPRLLPEDDVPELAIVGCP